MTLPPTVDKHLVDIRLTKGVDESAPEELANFTTSLLQAKNVRVEGGKLVTRPGVKTVVNSTGDPLGIGRLKTGLGMLVGSPEDYVDLKELNKHPSGTGASLVTKCPAPPFRVTNHLISSVQGDSAGQVDSGVGGVIGFSKMYVVLHAGERSRDLSNATRPTLTVVDRRSGGVLRNYQLPVLGEGMVASAVGVGDRYIHLYMTSEDSKPYLVVLDTNNLPQIGEGHLWVYNELPDTSVGQRIGGIVPTSNTSICVTKNPVRVIRSNNSGTVTGNVALTDMQNATGIAFRGGNLWVLGEADTFSPASWDLELWHEASFGGSPWAGTASVGASGSRSLTEATNPPSVGSAVNGFTPADFDGTNDRLGYSSVTLANIGYGATYGGWALVNVDTIANDSVNGYDSANIFGVTGDTVFGIYLRSSGLVGILHHDGGHKRATTSFTTVGWRLVHWRHNGTGIQIGVGGSWGSVTTAGTNSLTSHNLVVGRSWGGQFFDGKILSLGAMNWSPSDADITNLRGYLNARYGLSV